MFFPFHSLTFPLYPDIYLGFDERKRPWPRRRSEPSTRRTMSTRMNLTEFPQAARINDQVAKANARKCFRLQILSVSVTAEHRPSLAIPRSPVLTAHHSKSNKSAGGKEERREEVSMNLLQG